MLLKYFRRRYHHIKPIIEPFRSRKIPHKTPPPSITLHRIHEAHITLTHHTCTIYIPRSAKKPLQLRIFLSSRLLGIPTLHARLLSQRCIGGPLSARAAEERIALALAAKKLREGEKLRPPASRSAGLASFSRRPFTRSSSARQAGRPYNTCAHNPFTEKERDQERYIEREETRAERDTALLCSREKKKRVESLCAYKRFAGVCVYTRCAERDDTPIIRIRPPALAVREFAECGKRGSKQCCICTVPRVSSDKRILYPRVRALFSLSHTHTHAIYIYAHVGGVL